ncbi:LytR family transcriptional regulator, partial [Paenibacillus sp. MCAF20]
MQNKSKAKKTWKWILISILVIIVAVVGYAIYWSVGVYNALDNFKDPVVEATPNGTSETPVPIPEWEGTERVNILLLGGDARGLD